MKTRFWQKKRWWLTGALFLLVLLGFLVLKREPTAGNGTTFVVRRGPLNISVLEGGSVQALESQEIKCEVRVGYQGTKILKIVEEGYQVTEDDVRTNRILVELDSSEIKNRITQQDITFESTRASLVEAQQAYDIQVIQNFGEIKAAEQKVRFARLDLDRLLGDSTTTEIVDKLGLSLDLSHDSANSAEAFSPSLRILASMATNTEAHLIASRAGSAPAEPANGGARPAGMPPATLAQGPEASVLTVMASLSNGSDVASDAPGLPRRKADIDFSQYAKIDRLGDGEAKQKLRKFDDDFQLALKELGKATSDYEGTLRLFEKEYVTKTELTNSALLLENNRLKVQTAETARALYTKYEFLKACEEAVSKFEDALRELDRTRKSAVSKLAQAEARLKSAQGRYNLEDRQRKELYEQLDKCIIPAEKQGLVVYGGADEDRYWGGEERIREGATVRERQSIITIPDMTKMGVRVKIHETYIKRIKKGQKATITVDAYADQVLKGEVTKVGLLPDSGNRWMNPDLKVYLTTISVEGVHDWLKPGMSAKVEIQVDHLDDVVFVPIQAVFPEEGQQVCYLDRGAKRERRVVSVGESNDEFIEIKTGLKEGERICLRAPPSVVTPGTENG
ncbi:MAG TPA: HlyD family efflux transporter periplasmic adaptor subunit, partial [Candidatus Paceibacterota bacterium]|nr:HlyD family efflux transporter periplasmic adaptor subunit [Candidatus Paceibacterota bacterium]